MARFDGARQGLAVWLIGLVVVLVLAAAGAVLGAKYNVLAAAEPAAHPDRRGHRHHRRASSRWSPILVVTLVGAVLGGKLGERYHRKVDRAGFDA